MNSQPIDLKNGQRVAGWQYAGTFCAKCEAEVNADDVVEVNEDGEPDEYGGWHDYSRIVHVECPPDEA